VTEAQAQTQDNEEHPLDELARAAGDPGLFPDEVRALFDQGEARKARKALLRWAGEERNEDRAGLQREVAEHPRLWLDQVTSPPGMRTINGIGTMLYGRHQSGPDGTYIATLWFTLLFVPVWPLGSYLVAQAEEGGWYFLAKAPFSRLALGVRRFALIAILAITGQFAWHAYWSATHANILVYNGFDRPITITVGGTLEDVPPWSLAVFESLPLKPTSIEAKWLDERTPFESLEFDFRGHGQSQLIYNVANRGALRVDFIVYGAETLSEGWWLEGGPVVVMRGSIDYVLVDPPETKYLEEDKVVENSFLYDAVAGDQVATAVAMLLEEGLNERAMQVARAELVANPADAYLAMLTAVRLLADDVPAQLGLFRDLITRSPNTVDLHRYYQSLWPEDRQDEVKTEYTELLAEHPSDPMYHYLAGRLEGKKNGEASPAEMAHYTSALELDPDYPPVYRALGYHAQQAGKWATAFEHYQRYAAVDPEGGVDMLDERVRIGRRLGKPGPEMTSLLTNAAASGKNSFSIQRVLAHLQVADDPAAHAEAAEALVRFVEVSSGEELPAPFALNLQADMAITAGALDHARTALRQISPGYRSADIALRLALSSNATDEDELLLVTIPGWFFELDVAGKLMAFRLLNGEALAVALDQLDAEYRAVADLLQSPDRLKSKNRMIEATHKMQSGHRVCAYLAAADVLQSVPGSERARGFYLGEAYAMALPGELPIRE